MKQKQKYQSVDRILNPILDIFFRDKFNITSDGQNEEKAPVPNLTIKKEMMHSQVTINIFNYFN